MPVSDRYIDLDIRKDSFSISHHASKPLKYGAALDALQKIEKILDQGLKYAKATQEGRDLYAGLSEDQLLEALRLKAWLLYSAYQEKKLRLPWLFQQIYKIYESIFGIRAEATYLRVCEKMDARLGRVTFYPLNEDLIQKITDEYFKVSEVTIFSQVNRDGQRIAEAALIRRAKDCGYEGSKVLEARKHLGDVVKHARRFDWLCRFDPVDLGGLRNCFFHEDSGGQYIDGWQALENLRSLKFKDVVVVCSTRRFYHTQGVEAFKKLFKSKRNWKEPKLEGAMESIRFSALNEAARYGEEEILDLLLKHGGNLNFQTKEGELPICTAVLYQRKSVVEYLLEHGANPNFADGKERYPLHLAANNADVGMIKLLLNCSQIRVNVLTSEEFGKKTPLLLAIASAGSQEDLYNTVKLLLRNGADPNIADKEGIFPLHFAIRKLDVELVKLLLNDNRTQVDAQVPLELGRLTPLLFALSCEESRANIYQIVELLLERGANPNIADGEGVFPLHYATNKVDRSLVELLLSCKQIELDVTASEKYGKRTPLLLAIASKGSRENINQVVKLLLDHGANPNIAGSEGVLPLHKAASQVDVSLVELLLSCKQTQLNVAASEKYGKVTPLLLAINSEGSREDIYNTVKLLLDNGADPNIPDKQGMVPLHFAIHKADLGLVQLLLNDDRTQVNTQLPSELGRLTPLLFALSIEERQENIYQIVKLLLDHGANPNIAGSEGTLPLHYAASQTDVRLVELLLSCEKIQLNVLAPENFLRGTPLLLAIISTGSRENINQVVKLLLDHGANPNIAGSEGILPLHQAASQVDVSLVELLLSCKQTQLNVAASEKYDKATPLLSAINSEGSREDVYNTVKLLLGNGADPNIPDKQGIFPLHLAIEKADVGLVKLLLNDNRTQVDVQLPSELGSLTPLLFALSCEESQENVYQIVQLLLERGANPNIADSQGVLSLHYAANTVDVSLLELLLSCKQIQLNVPAPESLFRRTPLLLALSCEESPKAVYQVVELLLENGANPNTTDAMGISPIDYARIKRGVNPEERSKLLSLLVEHVENWSRN